MSDLSAFPPLRIIAYSDFYDVPDRKVWGDYWLKENLLREFEKAGYPVAGQNPAILLHLFGEPLKDLPSAAYPILWIHSHPDWITPEILKRYQKLYCISEPFTRKITSWGFEAEMLMVPTAMTPLVRKKRYDIVFVGNTKKGEKRKVIRDLGDSPYNVKVWGWGWKGLIPDKWYGGEYYENGKLNELYASSRVVLNDHHEDMRQEGFINPRILDVLASGGFVISDRVKGIGEIFGGSVPVYDTPEELRGLIDRYLQDDAGRERLAAEGRGIALRHTYGGCVGEITGHIASVSDTLFSWRARRKTSRPPASSS
jgi:spore maturation protein CgeB